MSRNKAKGTAWETRVVDYLRTWWPHAHRLPLTGTKDRGDITLGNGSPIAQQTKNVARFALAEWVDDVNVQADNAAEHAGDAAASWRGVVWVKRPGKASAADAYVVMDGWTFVQLLRDGGH